MKIPSTILKDENAYSVMLNYANNDLSYMDSKKFKFVPKSC